MSDKIYALMIGFCFGLCGNIIVGGIDMGEYGPAVPCKRPAAECPAFDKELDTPQCEVDGCDVYIRKLRME